MSQGRLFEAHGDDPFVVEKGSVEVIADRLFEALSHFPGESPDVDSLRDCLTSDARIVTWQGGTSTSHDREEWLAHVGNVTSERHPLKEGFFVNPRSSFARRGPDVSISQARLELTTTCAGAVVAREEMTCTAVMHSTGAGEPKIERLVLVYEDDA